MACTSVIEFAGPPFLWHLRGVNDGTCEIDHDALSNGCVEVECPMGSAGVIELENWREACAS